MLLWGEMLHDSYKEHQGYSSSVEKGLKRHLSAIKKLLKELSVKGNETNRINDLDYLLYLKSMVKEIRV